QTACTALAATIGTGNIAGVATALTAGGPGAIFWMWVSAGIGMMTGYAETMLGIRYRYRDRNGAWICGPMVYLERGLKL
ncbi:MAG TPA: sodium:alanine symporter family protein, partial [Lachnoclostridium sp.]|nr:sodium:alanine symporter family protein [Lachnoclostridium sp.]